MKKTDYAETEIVFTASEAKINSSDELKLSDELSEIQYELEEWLRKRLAKTPFGYRIRGS